MKHHRQTVPDRRIPIGLAMLAAVISVIAFQNLPGSTPGDSVRLAAAADPRS